MAVDSLNIYKIEPQTDQERMHFCNVHTCIHPQVRNVASLVHECVQLNMTLKLGLHCMQRKVV